MIELKRPATPPHSQWGGPQRSRSQRIFVINKYVGSIRGSRGSDLHQEIPESLPQGNERALEEISV